MNARRWSVALLATSIGVACGGPGAKGPSGQGKDFAVPFAHAMTTEAIGDQAHAVDEYLSLIDEAAGADGAAWQLAVLDASLDALILRTVSSFAPTTTESALAYRTTKDADIVRGLGASYEHARGSFAKGLIARALERLAVHSGDANTAEKWRIATGCAREATVTGPLVWTSILGVSENDPLANAESAIEKSYKSSNAFGTDVLPAIAKDRGCWIPLDAASTQLGTRDVIVDVDVPSDQTIGVALRSPSAATLRVGGKVVLARPYELGGGDVAKFASVDVGKGRVRMVARVGQDDSGESVEIDAWDAQGMPLAMHAPLPGERAKVTVHESHANESPAPKTDEERVLAATAALAEDDGRSAEMWLNDAIKSHSASLPLLLSYARAVEAAQDLSLVHRQERMRSAYERILEAHPDAWEAILAHAILAGSRKGPGEARLVSLGDLESHGSKALGANIALVKAFAAALSGREHLYDRASDAFESAKKSGLQTTSLLHDVERVAFDRAGDKAIAFECARDPKTGHSNANAMSCYNTQKNSGHDAEAAQEIDRLRTLRGAKTDLAALRLRDALGQGDAADAKKAWEMLLPGERTIESLAALRLGDHTNAKDLLALAMTARDAPASIPSLLRSLGDDPARDLDPIAEAVVKKDREKLLADGAATAVLLHNERYEIRSDGILHFVLLDVRRVNGTTDVEENAAASPPDLSGHTTMRILRRRIFKKDGRVLEPERAPGAAQAHADLAQLEAGDRVMAIYEGWTLPGTTGDIGIDTPDLLPERTAVVSAEIEIRMPKTLKGALYSHPILGKYTESQDGDQRVLRWSLQNRGTRRLEDGVPKMDRDVAVSFATMDWSRVGMGLRETIAGLLEHEPEVSAFAREAAAGKTGADAVSAIVDKVGETVRESSPTLLSDGAFGMRNGSQSTTARTILTDREGCRTWLIKRSLQEIGIASDIVIAENEPFSAHAEFPAHFGRFSHPLLVAHPAGSPEIWIDSDVSGPPLPAGRISPELRGRIALHMDGTTSALPQIGGGDRERDEIDLRLVLDANGDAKGSLTILLRGRTAQEISEALFRVVGIERERALRGIALGWVPAANIDQVALSSSEGSWQVAVRAEISAPGFAEQDAKQWVLPGMDPVHIVFPHPNVATLGATYASQGGREEALAINRAIQYHVHRRIELPKGTAVLRVPGPLDVKTANLEASRKLTVSGNVVEDELTLGIATGTVAADRYEAFVQGAHKVDDGFLASVRLTPPPK